MVDEVHARSSSWPVRFNVLRDVLELGSQSLADALKALVKLGIIEGGGKSGYLLTALAVRALGPGGPDQVQVASAEPVDKVLRSTTPKGVDHLDLQDRPDPATDDGEEIDSAVRLLLDAFPGAVVEPA